MSASQQAKQAGLKSLAEVSRLTGQSKETLSNWYKFKPLLFSITLLGCKAKLAKDALTCPRCNSDNVSAQWVEHSIGEYQLGNCDDCGLLWNECARDSEVWA
jgi:hypothetical protein